MECGEGEGEKEVWDGRGVWGGSRQKGEGRGRDVGIRSRLGRGGGCRENGKYTLSNCIVKYLNRFLLYIICSTKIRLCLLFASVFVFVFVLFPDYHTHDEK